MLTPDIKIYIRNFMHLDFFLSPVLWYPTGDVREFSLYWEADGFCIDIFRQPVIFDTIPLHSWAVYVIATGRLTCGVRFTALRLGKLLAAYEWRWRRSRVQTVWRMVEFKAA